MPNIKHYYVIYRVPKTMKTKDNDVFTVELMHVICIVTDEEIAKDFCKKNYGCDYYEETIDLHIGE